MIYDNYELNKTLNIVVCTMTTARAHEHLENCVYCSVIDFTFIEMVLISGTLLISFYILSRTDSVCTITGHPVSQVATQNSF